MCVAEPLPTLLIIEDEPDLAAILARIVEAGKAWQARVLTDPAGLDAALASLPDLVFTDLVMPGIDGFEVIRRVRERDADLPIVVISAHASIENAVRAVRAGAFAFLAKPFTAEAVELILVKIERERALQRRVTAADSELAAMLGESSVMQRVRQWIALVRPTRANVLIEGESGTGKELAARAIHGQRGPFIAINTAAIPEALAEAELFGYRRGAFTGATSITASTSSPCACPALRERREDIALLAENFLQRYARTHGRNCRRFAPEVLDALSAADWPGNVRKLENVIEQAVVLCPPALAELPLSVLPPAQGGQQWCEAAPRPEPSLKLADVERRRVHEVLRRTGGNKSEAARLLAIDYKTLLRSRQAVSAVSAACAAWRGRTRRSAPRTGYHPRQ